MTTWSFSDNPERISTRSFDSAPNFTARSSTRPSHQPSRRWLQTLPLHRLYRHRQHVVLLLQGQARLGVHTTDQCSIAIVDVDLGFHSPGLRIERVGEARDAALKGSIQGSDAYLYNGTQVNLWYGGLGHRDDQAQLGPFRQLHHRQRLCTGSRSGLNQGPRYLRSAW